MANDQVAISVIGASLILILLSSFIIYFVFIYRQKQREHEQQQKQLETKYNQALLESQLEIQEQVLRHISRELHDNLGQLAALVKLNLTTLSTAGPDTETRLQETRDLMKLLMSGLKELSVSLNIDYLGEEGLFKALEIETERLNRTGAIRAVFASTGAIPSLDEGKQIFLYRMCQELISNIVKHAEASEVQIHAGCTGTHLVIEVRDNGKGFDASPLIEKRRNGGSTGLRSLWKRARLIGAELIIDSSPGKGSSAKIHLSLQG